MPDIPFGSGSTSGEGGQSIMLSNELPHTPVFEVLGYPNYPFKVMVLENYYKNHWFTVREPEVIINLDENLDEI